MNFFTIAEYVWFNESEKFYLLTSLSHGLCIDFFRTDGMSVETVIKYYRAWKW